MPLYKANCKINIHLAIKEKLSNGYHSLETIFQEIPFYDILEISVRERDISFENKGIFIPGNDQNLCLKVAKYLKEKYQVKSGCHILLDKRVPVGAGLGGGSSDAAATIKALNALWQLNLTIKEMEEMSLLFGADIPFFIKGDCAYASGVGEKLTAINKVLKNGFLLLILPNIHISTKKAYENFNFYLTKKMERDILSFVLNDDGVREIPYHLFRNDFEPYIFHEYPEILKLKMQLIGANPRVSLVTGSGSAMFGFFDKYADAKKVFESLDQWVNKKLLVL